MTGMEFGLMDWALLAASLLSIVLYYFWRKNQYFKNMNMNYMKPQLFVGNMLSVCLEREHMKDVLQRGYDDFPNDRYFGIFNFAMPSIVVKDPDLLRKIMVKDFDFFTDHIDVVNEEADPVAGNMVFAMKGDKWKDMRSTLSPAFTSSKMRAMLPFMQECVDNLLEYMDIETTMASATGHAELEMKDLFTRYTNDVIASCAFGIKTNSLKYKENSFYKMAKESTVFTFSDSVTFLVFKMSPALSKALNMKFGNQKVVNFFRNVFSTNMKERLNHKIVRQDMIQLLMLAKQGNLHDETLSNEQDNPNAVLTTKSKRTDWTDDEILAQAMVFLFAGFDSSANLISFLSYELAMNPNIQKKLQEEIDEALSRSNGALDYQEIHKLKYLDMVISETLRLWPVAPNLDRCCVKPYEFPPQNDTSGTKHKLHKGDIILIPVVSLHRDPKYFENPNCFDPERFSDENKKLIKPFTYIPFGDGPRQCIASRFALMEAKVLAVNFLSKFEFVRSSKTPVPMVLKKNFFEMVAEKGFWVGVKPRK